VLRVRRVLFKVVIDCLCYTDAGCFVVFFCQWYCFVFFFCFTKISFCTFCINQFTQRSHILTWNSFSLIYPRLCHLPNVPLSNIAGRDFYTLNAPKAPSGMFHFISIWKLLNKMLEHGWQIALQRS